MYHLWMGVEAGPESVAIAARTKNENAQVGRAGFDKGVEGGASMRRRMITLFAVLVVVTPATGLAQPRDDYNKSGLYIAIGGGVALDTAAEDELRAVLDPSVRTSESGNVGIRLGYRLPYVATELDVEYLTGFDYTLFGLKVAEVTMVTFTSNLRAYLPMGRVQPYALFGVGLLQSTVNPVAPGPSGSNTSFALQLGGGLEVYVSKNFFVDVGAAYLSPFGENDGLDNLSIRGAVGYRF